MDPVKWSYAHKQIVSFVEALLDILVSELGEPSLPSSCIFDTSHCELPVGLKCKDLAVRVDRFLMDSGASLDLINRASLAKKIRRFIESCAPVVLDTANGESIADKSIILHLGCLGEQIAPLVLDSIPKELSLGRRVVDGRYHWHRLGGITTPWLVHPDIREVIPLGTEDRRRWYRPRFVDRRVRDSTGTLC